MVTGNHSLLIIDDDEAVRESIAAYLDDSGFITFEAASGQQGLELFAQHDPDVVLCDLKMPGMDGFGVLKAIAAQGSDTPVIVISGVGVMGDVVEALRFGASDYLNKPIADMAVLEHAIARCLEQGRLRRENREYRLQLEGANTELKQSLQILQEDQQAGRQVQLKMLPPTPKTLGEYRLDHKIVPSLYLSGDFIDYFTVSDRKIVFFIADVSGHGASSAFVTVLLKNIFARKRSNFFRKGDQSILSPAAMLQYANEELLETEIGKHVTLCVGVIDTAENELLYSVAGHLPLPILQSGTDCRYLVSEGMPIGLFEGTEYKEKVQLLPENFVLSFFSDGILEVLPAEGMLAKEDELLEKLSGSCASVEDVVSRLELEQIVDAPDDIAILVITKQ